MRINITRKPIKINPDIKRVIARFFFNSDERAKDVIGLVMSLSDKEVKEEVTFIFREFARRHRNISRIFERNCERLSYLFEQMSISLANMDTRLPNSGSAANSGKAFSAPCNWNGQNKSRGIKLKQAGLKTGLPLFGQR